VPELVGTLTALVSSVRLESMKFNVLYEGTKKMSIQAKVMRIAKLLNDNNIKYRIGSYSFLGESIRFEGNGFDITTDDGDQSHLKVFRNTPSAKALKTIAASEVGQQILKLY
jgi:hypothetical protein